MDSNEAAANEVGVLPLFVPAAFREHVKKLKGAPLSVYLIYVSRANKEGYAWPSIGGLARDCGLSPNSVKKARRLLTEHGYLTEFAQERDGGTFGKKKFRVLCQF